MARGNYTHELAAAATLPAALAMLEGGVVSVLAKLVFDVSDLAFATIIAAPMFANLTSLFWQKLAHGRRKTRMLVTLQSMILIIVAGIAALPSDAIGGAVLVGLVILARCIVAGMITVRSVIWRVNYRRANRARITGKFILLAMLIMAAAPLLGYKLLDYNPDLFRLLYPAAAGVGLIGVIAMSRVRVRRERQLLDYERRHHDEPADDDIPLQANGRPHGFVSVLREDRHFRSYMIWQFAGGMANIMGNAAMLLVIVELAKGWGDHKFVVSILLGTSVPMALSMMSLPFWARLLDGWHITQYRTIHALFFIATQVGNWAAAATGQAWLIALPRATGGLMMGGGALAWQLGHNDFADRRLAALYMGIHQTLTGVRGITAPYLGVGLLAGWSTKSAFGWTLPAWGGIGADVFLITTALAVASWFGFVGLYFKIKAEGEKAGT